MKQGTGWIMLVAALGLATGCAGGWRNGPPAGEADAALIGGSAAAPNQAGGGSSPVTTAGTAGVTFGFAGAAQSVNVAGDFNDWNTGADPMVQQADGTWKLDKKLAPGRYAYKFVIDGGTWMEDPSASESVDDGYGGKNSVIVVAAGGAPSPSAGTNDTGGSLGGGGAGAAPEKVDGGIRFTYGGAARTVHLCGDFNAWSTTSDPMKLEGGVWTIVKPLEAGRYEYKFLIDGSTWKTDAANSETSDDGFGGANSVLTVD